MVFGTETQQVNSLVFSDTKLQTLDRRVGKDNLYFDKEMFMQSLNDWENIPVIYQPQGIHPNDFKAVAENPFKAAENIGGKLVGRVHNPHIVIEGGARLMATLSIDGDTEEIENLWQTGKLFPSTAFSTHSDGDKITTPPIPNHVLIFPIQVDKVVPGDFGAYVNSQEVEKMPEETTIDADNLTIVNSEGKMPFSQYLKSMISRILNHKDEEDSAKLDSVKPSVKVVAEEGDVKAVAENPSVPDVSPAVAVAQSEEVQSEETEKVEETQSEVTAEVTEEVKEETPIENTAEVVEESKQVENTELMNAIAERDMLRKELEEYKHTEREQKFSRLLNSLPVGMTATEEQKKAIREQYENDLEGLLFSVLENKQKEGVTEKAGMQFTHSDELVKTPLTTVGDLSKKQ